MRNAFADAGLPFVFNGNFTEAITQSLSRADSLRCPVLVTGSFYLAGEVKKILNAVA
jgi:folylpolyglutamate synthase/dihydropteroate synthase